MGELAQKVIRDIEAAKGYDDISQWIGMAGDLIRKAAQPGYLSGFEEIDRETVNWAERQQRKEVALRTMERDSDPLWIQSMLSVLLDTRDHDLKSLWIGSLANYLSLLKRANATVYTARIALREIGEPVSQLARGVKNPTGAALALLNIIRRKRLEAIL